MGKESDGAPLSRIAAINSTIKMLRTRPLLFEDFLYIANLILNFAFDLFGCASVSQIGIADRLTHFFLHSTHRLFACPFRLILIA